MSAAIRPWPTGAWWATPPARGRGGRSAHPASAPRGQPFEVGAGRRHRRPLHRRPGGRAALPFTLRPGESATKEILYTPTEAGVLRGRFEIGADRFPDDDSFLFVLHVVPQLKVLLVNGYPAADPFENEALYVRTALATPSDRDRDQTANAAAPARTLGPSTEFLRSLDVREITENQLNAEALRETGVVILMNCGGLNGEQYQLLREFVRAGGGLLIFPGDKVNPESYSRQFFPVPGQPGESLAGGDFGAPEGDLTKRDSFVRLASIDFAHPGAWRSSTIPTTTT